MSSPADATQPAPPPPAPTRGCLTCLKWTFALAYALSAGALAAWLASFASEGGLPVAAFLPDDAALLLRVRNGDAIWRNLENDPRVLALWQDEDVQTQFHWQKSIGHLKRDWEKWPRFAQRWFPFERQTMAFVLGGETALTVSVPQPETKPPALIFIRLNGGMGALLRLVLHGATPPPGEPTWRDLGGGLVVQRHHGSEPERSAPLPPAGPLPDDAAAELLLQPAQILRAMPLHVSLKPSVPQLIGLNSAPETITLLVRAPGDGSLALEGIWRGALPPAEAPAPLLEREGGPAQPPMLEAEAPIDVHAAFLWWLDGEMQSDKGRRRWENRLLELEKAGVDLNKDLWPATGKRLRLAIAAPDAEAGEKIARVSLALPFMANDKARRALAELARVRWDGLTDARTPPADDARIYVRRFKQDAEERYVLVKKNPPVPLWVAGERTFAAVSDAGPLAPMFGAQELRLGAMPSSGEPRAIFQLRFDGPALAPQVAAYRQAMLEDERDDIGAAKFMDKYPDEQLPVRLAEKLARFAGTFSLEMRAQPAAGGKPEGRLQGRWRPAQPDASAAPVPLPPAPEP